jgi:hypothetical protein
MRSRPHVTDMISTVTKMINLRLNSKEISHTVYAKPNLTKILRTKRKRTRKTNMGRGPLSYLHIDAVKRKSP